MYYDQKNVNLHTHSFYCGHGKGQVSDFVKTAQETNTLKILGFSEHCPVFDDALPSRMPFAQYDNYIRDVRELQKSEDDIKILLGAECDWDSKYTSFYKDCIVNEKQADYIIGSVHFAYDKDSKKPIYIPHLQSFDLSQLKDYAKRYTDMIESKMFLICCHPDLFFGAYKNWDAEAIAVSKDIIQCAKANNTVLELNDLGLRKKQIETKIGLRHQYSIKEFWYLAAQENVAICTNTDAHFPEDVCGYADGEYLNASHKFAAELGIKFTGWEIETFKGQKKAVIRSVN